MLPVHEFSKIKRSATVLRGGGGEGRGQSVKLLPRADTNLIFGTLERTRYPILIVKLKNCEIEFIKALKLDLERTKTLKNATMSGQKVP